MTTSQSRTQRLTARSIIAAFVILGLVIMFVPSGALGSMFALQETNSPTGSATPTDSASPSDSPTPEPSPTDVQPIQFLNPSGHSDVVSTKDDGTNTTYHLVAVVKDVPTNPLVEFKYQSGDANEVSIGIATRVGTTDTFHLQWAVGALADGSYTLKAILFNGAIELGRDEQDVTVNNADDLDDPQAESVEIVSPAPGAGAGFFQPAGQETAHTVMAVTSSDSSGLTSGSTGTDSVTVYYTKTPIGSEPEWIECGSGGTEGAEDPPTTIRCALEEGDAPPSVTGLAAVASQVLPLIDGSGDAHRVFPYTQIPTDVQLAPTAQSGKEPGVCADAVVATLVDQNNAPIAGANVDVHAKGPTDNLRFDDSGNNSSAHQAPDKAHTEPEEGWNCEGTGAGGAQGDHENPPGSADVKHIESTTGTSDAGMFTFQLYSPNGPGQTEFGVWADTDDDDQWCATEASEQGSIGWAASASPSPTPTSSPTQSPSESPSGSPTNGGGSPTGSPTGEPTTSEIGPERQTCPVQTGSPTPTEEPASNRSITIEANKSRVLQRRPVTLSGRIDADNPQCADNEVVEIERRIHGTNNFKSSKTTATEDDGTYSVRVKPARGADFRAIAPAADACDEASSTPATVRVRPRVRIAAENYKGVPRGSRLSINGDVTPGHTNDRVVLQRKKGGKWVKVKAQRLNRNSRYRFVVRANFNRRDFRVLFKKQDQDHVRNTSRVITIRTV